MKILVATIALALTGCVLDDGRGGDVANKSPHDGVRYSFAYTCASEHMSICTCRCVAQKEAKDPLLVARFLADETTPADRLAVFQAAHDCVLACDPSKRSPGER